MTIGQSIASVGLLITAWIMPSFVPMSVPLFIGAGMGSFWHYVARKYDQNSIDQIEEYQATLNQYVGKIQNDIKVTDEMINFFDAAEQMLIAEKPFDKDQWQQMMKHISQCHFLKIDQ